MDKESFDFADNYLNCLAIKCVLNFVCPIPITIATDYKSQLFVIGESRMFV